MKNWVKRDNYLIKIGERLLRGEKTFTLRRVHLVKPSGISRGTVYNHYPCEQDLILALCHHHLERQLLQAQQQLQESHCQLQTYLLHQCWVLWDSLNYRRFLPQRLMPNKDICSKASPRQQQRYRQMEQDYKEWLTQSVSGATQNSHIDHSALLQSYIRGFLIQSDDQQRSAGDIKLYQDFCFGLTQLLGCDRVPEHFIEHLETERRRWEEADFQSQLAVSAKTLVSAKRSHALQSVKFA